MQCCSGGLVILFAKFLLAEVLQLYSCMQKFCSYNVVHCRVDIFSFVNLDMLDRIRTMLNFGMKCFSLIIVFIKTHIKAN